jgi:alanine-glyoxylate transaminase/serine-glyoxylate transaminase/serine-pyruvate transaminase
MDAGRFFQDQVRSRGLELLAEPDHQLPQLTAVRVPEGVDAKGVQMRMLREHGIEIGGGLGPTAPDMWRIGLMGHNARRDVADRVLAALDESLAAVS